MMSEKIISDKFNVRIHFYYFRNDFDWSEVSLAAGDGWGEYIEEYESSLCVSLDIDHGYRWDTR